MTFVQKSFFLLAIIALAGCSTKKNTALTRSYHNLTSRYNVFFNGNESLKKGVKKLETSHRDDYTQLLPVFPYGVESEAQTIAGDMDRTLKKGSKLITFHSIKVKPEKKKGMSNQTEKDFYNKKEYNNWVDNAYMMIGKAHFYKMDYFLANEAFRFVISEYGREAEFFPAHIWLARGLICTGEYKDALELLTKAREDKEFPQGLQKDYLTTLADLYLRQKQFTDGEAALKEVITLEKNKKLRARYLFIRAQINEKSGNAPLAIELYSQVIRLNPSYEMTFNARINRALAYQKGTTGGKGILSELQKMLRDEKNLDYRDQIYYAMANIYYRDGNLEKAIECYILSTQTSVDNNTQLGLSFLRLADIYYAKPDYIQAQAYYDSSVTNLPSTYPDYPIFEAKARSLTQLVTNINEVKLQDSLQYLASLDESARNKVIDGIIQSVIAHEQELKNEEAERRQEIQTGRQMSYQNRDVTQSTGGAWYFYNPAAKSLGRTEFELKWGKRRLEDNWRRKNKTSTGFELTQTESEDKADTTADGKKIDNKMREFYLRDLPLTDSLMGASHEKIKSSLYNAAIIYKNELKDYDLAVETFEDLINRYPNDNFSLMACYQLFDLYRSQNNTERMEYYRRLIISKFPDSMYARVMRDPGYFRQLAAKEEKIRKEYEETYNLFTSKQYAQVVSRVNQYEASHGSEPIWPKFEYLRVLSQGKQTDQAAFRSQLNEYIKKYPEAEEIAHARNIIGYMDRETPELLIAEEKKIALEIYAFAPAEPHFAAFVVPSNTRMVNQLVFNIVNFNLDNFDNLNLQTEAQDISQTDKLVLIKSFNNRDEAQNYFLSVTVAEMVYKDIDRTAIQPCLISQSNLQKLIVDKKANRYIQFYKANY